ncbi:MAG: XdhC family protein [Bacillota bacterium]|jgi:xanthine dehydrogenase accessory factor
MKKLFSKMYDTVLSGESVVLASVVASSGSTPRGEGAKMIVNTKGEFLGTIGGGAVEYKSQQLAKEVLKSKQSYAKGFILAPNEVADLGMICGGDVVVYFQYFAGGDQKNIELLKKIVDLFDQDVNSWLITEITDETAWNMSVYVQGQGFLGDKNIDDTEIVSLLKSRNKLTVIKGKKYYVESLTKAGKVYIFGGGHISQELVPVLAHIDFNCVVIDDRQEFANTRLFPLAEEVHLGDFYNIGASVNINSKDYIVIVTRGHKNDYDVLKQALRTDACYIGMVGSRTKIASTFKRLIEEEGFKEADLKRINTPIGLPIKAETPAEIAISIAGEMIEVRAMKNSHE